MTDHTTSDGPALAVIILAAGQGTRMKSRLPKVLHRIGGRPLVGHVLDVARDLHPAAIRIVLRHERDLIAEAVSGIDPDIQLVDQDEIPGTGRAVQQALDELADFSGDVLVLSGDVPLLDADTLTDVLRAHRAAAAAATVLTAVLDDPTGYGRIIRDGSGLVERIVEQRDATDDDLAVGEVNSGVYVFDAEALRQHIGLIGTANAQGERYLTDVLGLLRGARQSIAAVAAPDPAMILGVNDRVQLSEAARALNARTIRKWQREGVTVEDPATTWIDVTATFGRDVTLLPGTQILRATTVADGATIGPDTSLVDCEVGEDAVIRRSDATLAVVGARASVGPYAYLRPGAVLADDAKVGTFVEVKNSEIGEGSKVPHLSYIGDTTIGRGVNLGAGAITANYDDVAKHRTQIGDEVHTGSHNVFVAPVRIGDGAKTGAGAVVRKDVPPGALALSVAPQRNVAGWVEQHRSGTAAAEAAEAARKAQEASDGSQEAHG